MYVKQYKAFSENTHLAARTLYYYLGIEEANQLDTQENEAINKSARFWLDWRYIAQQTVIIILFKIFDDQKRTYNIQAMMRSLPFNLNHFSKPKIRERKFRHC